MDWLHPTYGLALLAVPLAAGLFWWAARQRKEGRARFSGAALFERLAASADDPRRRAWKAALVVGAVLLLAAALAGPRYGTKVREVERTGVDLVIALDVSNSMLAEDVAPSRLERAKNEISSLLSNLTGDRVGLVLFAGDAFVQCPLTSDYSAVRLFLDVAEPSLLPTPGTDFGAALSAAEQAFDEATPQGEAPDAARTKALLVVSDGENHEGEAQAVAEEAQDAGIVVYAAGVGERSGAPIPVYRSGQRVGYKRYEGQIVQTRLEEQALTALAQNGAYFRVARASSALSGLPAALRRLEQTTFDAEQFEEYAEQFQWPLAFGLLLLFAEPLLRTRRSS